MILNLDKNKKTESDNYDAVIIGGGPAGLTAAIYLGRARIKTLVIEEMIPGGQAATTVRLENYPGFPEGIGGAELGSLMEKQAKNFGADIVYDNVIDVDFNNEEKIIKLNKREIRSKIVIIASGAKPRKMKVPGAEKFEGKGISYCATCDGPLFRDKNIAIIGGGNSAIEEAIFLLRFVKSITIVQDLPKDKAYLTFLPFPTELCVLCNKRTRKGLDPACVQHCMANCLTYGNLRDLSCELEKKPRMVLWSPK